MSARDRDRLKVLHEAEKGHLTQKQAGVQLKVSERWVRKLMARLRKEGDGGILHRLPGREDKLLLVVVAGFGREPMLLLTNLSGARDSQSLGWIVRIYLTRWKIEEYFSLR